MKFGSLFSGIGGLDLGLERAGMSCAWQVEKDEFCQRVLAKHWPDVARYGDVTALTGAELEPVECLAGGFPCQDISSSGKKVGLAGQRSGLWYHYARLIRVLRPRFVIVENVADLFTRGFSIVLSDLASEGYRCEWALIPAASFGSPQRRFRLFIVADSGGGGCEGVPESDGVPKARFFRAESWPDADGLALAEHRAQEAASVVRRVGDGLSAGVDRTRRVRGLGNAVVPQVGEWIGARVMERVDAI